MNAEAKQAPPQDARVNFGEIRFQNPILSRYAWPLITIEASSVGPRLCVMAGMHVNEVSSMEAALRLVPILKDRLNAGRVEIIPVVNVPALWTLTVSTCPEDGKNINFSFPGDPQGSFSEALAYAVLNEWAQDAALLIDLHGGDLPTQVSYFTMCQLIGNAEFDARTRLFASCFDADLHVEFAPGNADNNGRACNARPMLGKYAVMAEGGGNGLIDTSSVDYHVEGVLRCAAQLGLIERLPPSCHRKGLTVDGFVKVEAPVDGRFYPVVDVAERVSKGQVVGELKDVYGQTIEQLTSPADGVVVYRITHPMVTAGFGVVAIGEVL